MRTPAINNGIRYLEKLFNKKIKFIVFNTYIKIYTDINTINDLELFIAELKKTHIYTNPIFEHVSVKVDILHTHTGNGYHIMVIGSDSLNSDGTTTREEEFCAIVYK